MSFTIKNSKIFRVLQITDLHFGALPWNGQDKNTEELLKKASEKLNPDLLIFTGDNIWSEGIDNSEGLYRKFLEVASDLGIPYMVTYGNHDSEGTLKREDLIYLERGRKNLMEGDEIFFTEGRKNTYTDLLDEAGKKIMRIFILDSGDYGKYGLYAALNREQAEFTSEKSLGAENSIVFMHIPLPEYWEGLEKIETGIRLEENKKISSPEINTGFFAHVLGCGKVNGIFAGHDHDNNFTFTHFGIELGYGNVSGYNCYGELKRGVRYFDIDDKGKYTTGIITDDDM